MGNVLIQGNFMGKAIKVELGINKKGIPELRVDFEIVGGEHTGRRVPYSGLFTEKSVKYTRVAMVELGWASNDANTAIADITKAAKTVAIEVTVASWRNPDTNELREWSTVRNVGTYTAPMAPLDNGALKDINSWLNEAASPAPAPSASGGHDIPF